MKPIKNKEQNIRKPIKNKQLKQAIYRDEHKKERKDYYDNNYDKICKYKDTYAAKCKANPLECSKCGKSVSYKYMYARHQATYTCQTFSMENQPTWDEWEKQRLDELAKQKL